MDIRDSNDSIALPVSDNDCFLMGFQSCFSDSHTESVLESGSSLPSDSHVNVISGLEDKGQRRINALEFNQLVEAQDAFVKAEDKNMEEELPVNEIIVEDEQDEFPGLSPLRGDCVMRSSTIGNGVEVEYISRLFEDGRDCIGCENFLFSPRVHAGGPSVDVNRDADKERDGFCRPSSNRMVASEISHGCTMEEKHGSSSNAEFHKFNTDSGNVANVVDRTKDNKQLFISQNGRVLPLQYARKLKDSHQFNNFACSHEKKIAVEEIFTGPHTDLEPSCSAQGSNSEQTYYSALERSISEKLSHPFACCSMGTAEVDVKRISLDSFNKRTTNFCSNDKEVCTDTEKVVGAIENSSSIIFRRTNPKRAVSLRSNLAEGKFGQLNAPRSDRRKCRSKVGASSSCAPIALTMFGEVKRKIRNSHRQARLSVWGTAENLFPIIKQRDELIKHDSEPNAIRKRRSKSGYGANRRKRTAALKSKQSLLSSNKTSSSCQSIPPIMGDVRTSLKNGIDRFMATSDGHTASETSSTKVELDENYAEKWYYVVSSNMREGQQGEKDLESSLTQETSADNLLSECHGVSSRVDLQFIAETIDDKQTSNLGNSPDSDVYNPPRDVDILTGEGSAFIKLESLSDQNSKSLEPKAEDGLPSAELNFIEPFVARLPLLAKQVQACEKPRRNPKKSKMGKTKMKEKKGESEQKGKKEKTREKIGQVSECTFLISDPSCIEERWDRVEESNEVKKVSLSSNCCIKDKGACEKGGKCSKSIKFHFERRSKSESLLPDSSDSGVADLDSFNHHLKVQNGAEITENLLKNDDDEQLEAFLPSDYVKECQVRKSTKKKSSKNKSNCTSIRQRSKIFYGQQKINMQKSDKIRLDNIFPKESDNLGLPPGTTNKLTLPGGQIHGDGAVTDTLLKDVSNDVATPVSGELSARELYDVLLGQSSLSGKKAWALCDECQKWRCVPDELVHVIEKNNWTCKDNIDEAFADCTIPQEKTDDEINNDLGISVEGHCSTTQCYGEPGPLRLSDATRTMWTRIKSNLFLHRNRRTLTIDEIMVCHCKPPPDGSLGCGEECLNRMLNIECVKGTCPCGNQCSNQQFQKRKYSKFKWIKCGKKGYGLQLEETVSRGQFLIEYVGEVLDLATYEERLRYYAGRAHKHFYFMTLNGGEVIDACSRGNLGRYVNHSCDPNCRTEKWMVNGEVCIGLFAIRDIKKGEEITFDYNYVRVFGAAAKKCVCGSVECRGYIGGDPSSSDVIVQDDSDADDLDPIMIDEYGDDELGAVRIDSDAPDAKVAYHDKFSPDEDTKGDPITSEQGACVENQNAIFSPSSDLNLTDTLMQSSNCVESKSSMCRISDDLPFQDLQLDLNNIEPDQTFCDNVNESPPLSTAFEPLPLGQLSERSKHSLNTLHQSYHDHAAHQPVTDDERNISSQNLDSFMHRSSYVTCPIEEILTASKSNNVLKTLQHVKVKRSRVSIRSTSSGKTKKVSAAISGRHNEGVEEKLNELLDEDGGIRRQKDAAKGYLKLLVVTAAAGDETSGSMSQSARDLSLILDAILKTKSRMVLVDIINKNGLQMLHNMLKQNRDNFNRIPILRKLVKVLEFLAEKEILTKDHIYAAPPCSGMESFKESMLKLMKHRDTQVLLIARNFADQWIPRNYRRAEPSERDGRHSCATKHPRNNWFQASKNHSWHDQGKPESAAIAGGSVTNCLPSSAADFQGEASSFPTYLASSSASLTDNIPLERTRSRKRKSPWELLADATNSVVPASGCSADKSMLSIEVSKQKSEIQTEANNSSDAVFSAQGSIQQNSDDDDDDGEMPPGFESSSIEESPPQLATTNVTGEVAIGHPMERYLPHLTISYGIPINLMHQLGTPETEVGGNQLNPSWRIAPSMPFKPFPPLPSYPRPDPHTPNAWNGALNGNSNTQTNVKGFKERSFHCRNERARFPRLGNGRRFFRPHPQSWDNQRPQRCGPQWSSQGGNALS